MENCLIKSYLSKGIDELIKEFKNEGIKNLLLNEIAG